MKTRKMFTGIFALFLLFCVVLMAEPVKVIAVHYGNPEYEKALSKDYYPGFEFYHTDGTEWMYMVENTLFIGGTPSHLEGLYGEVPEKMGFSASFATEKGGEMPYKRGVIYVVASNGVIAAQTGPYAHFSDDHYPDEYWADYDNLKKNLKNIKKGKLPKELPAAKQVYFKMTPCGEREPYKKSVVDKKAVGITGWQLPDVAIYDEEGTKVMLRDLVKDENCFVVFYTLNAIKRVEGDRKTGDIVKEYYNDMPVNAAREAESAVKKAENAQSKEDVKDMFKSMLKATSENINSFYQDSIRPLEMVKSINQAVK